MKAKEINFYQIDDVVSKSVAPLMLKVLGEKKRALIFCQDEAKIKEIDDGLWRFGKFHFIAHAVISEKNIQDWQDQPILITNEEENKNASNYLVLTQDCSRDFLDKFERIFYFYDSTQLEDVKKFHQKFAKDFAVKSYKKVDRKWQVFEF